MPHRRLYNRVMPYIINEKGVDIRSIQLFLRHKNSKTIEIYIHVIIVTNRKIKKSFGYYNEK